jgi:integrase
MRSALKMVAKVLDTPLKDLPSSPPKLGPLLYRANPALAHMTRTRWVAVVSLVRGALAEAGVEVMPGRDIDGLDPEWRALADKLPGRRHRYGLSSLMSFFSRSGVAPSAVDASALESFRDALATTSFDPTPLTTFNRVARLWNEAGEQVPEWPQPRAQRTPDPRRYSLPWDHFPPTFLEDVERFLGHTGNQNPLSADYAPSVKPSTTENRRQCLRQLASALVVSGFPVLKVTGLAALVEPDNATAALQFFLDRNGGKTPQLENLAQLLCTIARHWVKAPAHDKLLRQVTSNLRDERKGMTAKNRACMRQFTHLENRYALLTLPARVAEHVRRHDQDRKGEAVRLMLALAVEILIKGAPRINNLAGLEVERHLVRVRRAGKVHWHILVPEGETKTGVRFEMRISPETAKLLTSYLENYRERVCSPAGIYLFPGRGGGRRSTESFGQMITEFVNRETGLKMTPHQFRHLVGALHLQLHPEDIETVRQMLGHKSTRTTLKAYADIFTEAAQRRWDETIATCRTTAESECKQRPSARRRAA